MAKSLLFELIVPCFNEAESLPILIEGTVQAAQDHGLTPEEFQLVVVNNGSTDATAQVVEKVGRGTLGAWIRPLHLQKNQGYGGGIYAGLCSSRAPWLGYSHADLQCDPKDVFRALKLALEKGNRTLVRGVRSHRTWSAWCISRCYELMVGLLWGFWCFDLNAQPKVFHRTLLEKWGTPPSGITFDAFVLAQAYQLGFERKNLKVKFHRREYGESHWARGVRKRIQTYARVLRELHQASSKVR